MFYRVIAGSFKDKKNAEDMIVKLKKEGINAFLMPFEEEKKESDKSVGQQKSKQYSYKNLNIIETTADNIKIALLNDTLKGYNGINGTFFWAGNTIGIAINEGKRIQANSHVAYDVDSIPRGTIFYKNGKMYIDRIWDIRPYNPDWAISGVMLYPNFNPKVEGFYGKYSDVLRATFHTAIGFRGNKIYLITTKNANLTVDQFRISMLNSNIAFDGLINLDGGGSTQMSYNGKNINVSSRPVVSAVLLKEI